MTTAPYDPRSGNTPDARPLDIAGMRYQAQAPTSQAPTETIVDQYGNNIDVYTSGPMAGRDAKGNIVIQQADQTYQPFVTGNTDTTEKPKKKSVGIYTDPTTGNVIERYNDGSEVVVKKGTIAIDKQTATDATSAAAQASRQSAYDLLNDQFSKMGLGSLVEPLKGLIVTGASPAEFTIKLRETPAYQKRFSANAERIKKGLTAIDEAAYLRLEDQYQNVMRNYGLPETYWTRGDLGVQEGFNKLIANDVSNVELENRIMTAQDRVLKANPQVLDTLKQFYPGITNGDILAYSLDPANALKDIQRKVTNAEIGGAALSQTGLTTSLARAEELQKYGVDKAAATAGYSAIGEGLQRGSELASIYGQSPYTQATAESEVFKLSGQQEARKQRQKVTGLEKATFGGQTGLTSGALARDRAGGY
jgi:hypothetical protein